MGTGVRVGAGAEGDFRKWITRVTEVLSVGLSAEEAVLSPSGALWGWDESRVPRLVPFPAAHQSYPIDAPATPPPSTPPSPPHHCPCASVFLTTPFTPFTIQIAAMCLSGCQASSHRHPPPPHLHRQSHSWTCPQCGHALTVEELTPGQPSSELKLASLTYPPRASSLSHQSGIRSPPHLASVYHSGSPPGTPAQARTPCSQPVSKADTLRGPLGLRGSV